MKGPAVTPPIVVWWAHQGSNLGPSDYEGKLKGRRYRVFPRRRLFFCPWLPWVSTVSMGLRRDCVELSVRPPALSSHFRM